MPFLAAPQQDLLADEMACQESMPALPQGIVHGDLFRDNVLFSGEVISGVLDFYFAGNDDLLFDLAVAANDWCVGRDGDLDTARVQALLGAYHALRPLQDVEAAAWPLMLRRAALRFWLSRLEDFLLPRPGRQVLVKDPGHFQALLQARRNTANPPWLG
jgi:homoserine kinase type II